jgi:hypothetical protein
MRWATHGERAKHNPVLGIKLAHEPVVHIPVKRCRPQPGHDTPKTDTSLTIPIRRCFIQPSYLKRAASVPVNAMRGAIRYE